MKKKWMSVALAIVILLGFALPSYAVSDINKHWAKKFIAYVMEKEIIVGYEDNTYRPDNPVTRAEFSIMLNRAFEYSKEAKSLDFKDVKKKNWYYSPVAIAVEAGYMRGYDNNTFKPNGNITREEAAVAFVKAGKITEGSAEVKDFKDKKEISKWARNSVNIMASNNYITGNLSGEFSPKNNITRGEMAKILHDILKHNEEDKPFEPDKPDENNEKLVYSVQVDSFKSKNDAIEFGEKLFKEGFKDIFVAEDNHKLFYIIAGTFKNEKEAVILAESIGVKSYPNVQIVYKDFRNFKVYNFDHIGSPDQSKEVSKLISDIEMLPEAKDIKEFDIRLKTEVMALREIYDHLINEEKLQVPTYILKKLEDIENKLNTFKTPKTLIVSKPSISYKQAQEWARKRGASKNYIDIAETYWKYGKLTGLNPEVLYAQAGKETGYGKYGGKVLPEMNNWAGIKTAKATGDETYDHETFKTPDDGVRGHFNHMGIYAVKNHKPIGEPHPRYHLTKTVSWAGDVQYVEDLGGKWAPDKNYGISIVKDLLEGMLGNR